MLAVGGVRVRDAGTDKGRGVFAERAASIGALLLREVALAAVPRDLAARCTQCLQQRPPGGTDPDAGADAGCASRPGQNSDATGRWRTCACRLLFCTRCWAAGGDVHEQTAECKAVRESAGQTDGAVLLGLRCHAARVECAGPLQFERLMCVKLDSTLRTRARVLSELLRHTSLTPPAAHMAGAERVVAQLARNVVSVGNHRGPAGSALFCGVAMLNHSCDPNAFVWFSFGGAEGRVVAEVRASRAILPGEEVCIDVSSVARRMTSRVIGAACPKCPWCLTRCGVHLYAWLRCDGCMFST